MLWAERNRSCCISPSIYVVQMCEGFQSLTYNVTQYSGRLRQSSGLESSCTFKALFKPCGCTTRS